MADLLDPQGFRKGLAVKQHQRHRAGECSLPDSFYQSPRLARDIERELRHDHLALWGQAHEIDGAGIFRRAGITGAPIADHRGPVPMTERDVVGAGCRDLRVADEPTGTQPCAAVGPRLIMSMPDRDLPARAA